MRDLTAEIMTVQAAGDGAKAAELLRARGAVRPEVKAVLDRLTESPSTSSRASSPPTSCSPSAIRPVTPWGVWFSLLRHYGTVHAHGELGGDMIGYDDCGAGPATVLLHPFPLRRDAWAGTRTRSPRAGA